MAEPTTKEIKVSLKYFAKPNGELDFVARLLSSAVYFSDPAKGNNSNTVWIESVWQDLFGRTSVGDPLAGMIWHNWPSSGRRQRLQETGQASGSHEPVGGDRSRHRRFPAERRRPP